MPFLAAAGLVEAKEYDSLDQTQRAVLDQAAPLAQTRVQQLDQLPGLIGFLFRDDVEYDEKAVSKLKGEPAAILEAAAKALETAGEQAFADTEAIHEVLNAALIDGLGVKPRVAFAPLFVAVTGTNVSIPVFDSMRILGKEETLRRIKKLTEFLG